MSVEDRDAVADAQIEGHDATQFVRRAVERRDQHLGRRLAGPEIIESRRRDAVVGPGEIHKLRPAKSVDNGRAARLIRQPEMNSQKSDGADFVKNSVLYKEFLAEREEILRHKWIESEKAGHDIGFEKALLDWIVKHRSSWRSQRHAT